MIADLYTTTTTTTTATSTTTTTATTTTTTTTVSTTTKTTTTTTTTVIHYYAVAGNVEGVGELKYAPQKELCLPHSDTTSAAVRCCSEAQIEQQRGTCQQSTCKVCGHSQFTSISSEVDANGYFGCLDGTSWGSAADRCKAESARLCTQRELMDGCSTGTGCGHDARMIWSSTQCLP